MQETVANYCCMLINIINKLLLIISLINVTNILKLTSD